MTAWLPLWQALPRADRAAAALHLLETSEESHATRSRVIACLARRRGFRPARLEKRDDGELARLLATVAAPPAGLVADLLPALFLGPCRELLVALLDRLGVPHHDGVLDTAAQPAPVPATGAEQALAGLAGHPQASLLPILAGTLVLRHPEIYAALPGALEGGTSLVAPEQEAAEVTPGDGPAPAEEIPESLTVLDRLLIRTVVAAAAGETGALDLDEAEELVDEVVHLNSSRHASYFHRGFLDGIRGRDVLPELPEMNEGRLAWLSAGWLSAHGRRRARAQILAFLEQWRPALAPILQGGHPAAPYGLPSLLHALAEAGRAVEIPDLTSPAALARCGPDLHSRLLAAATRLLREQRHEQAGPLLDLLARSLAERARREEAVPAPLRHAVHRRRAHAFRLRGDFDRARAWLEPLAAEGPRRIRSQVLADLGLVACRIRSLGHLRLPEDGALQDLAAALEPGLDRFRQAVEADPHQGGHGAWCLGIHALGTRANEDALRWLERAEAGFARRPQTYQPLRILPRARLLLGLALTRALEQQRVQQARECLEDGARALGREGFPLAVEGVLNLAAMSRGEAGRLVESLLAATQDLPEARERLLEEVSARDRDLLRRSPALLALLEERARQDGRSLPERVADLRLLAGLAAENDDGGLSGRALDGLQALASEDPRGEAGEALREVLEDQELASTAWSQEEILNARAGLHLARGEPGGTAALLEELAFTLLASSDAHRVDEAEGVVADIANLGVEGYPSETLQRRLHGLAAPPETSPPPPAVRGTVLFVGGNEVQRRYEDEVREVLAGELPGVEILFESVGWSSNWGRQVEAMRGRFRQADVVVLMRFVRTHLGRSVRELCGEHGIPWVACTGHGKASIRRSLQQAAGLIGRVGPPPQTTG